ncbi:hypothetical protein OE88DRAFT_1639926 [Heliocybe sulcata]|uniref:SnoaL-like domain-containing protein n=1 Tax=Heliocybe sulcata TaxID=5364 RepID=A0A5C3MJC4_9AGAM|nr:hypothetical protein OE88DRAFT_1639926 [Heliocybe sulcata]
MASTNETPDLESWAKSRIASLYETLEEEQFHTAFDSCFSPDAQVIMNHEPVSRDNAKSDLLTKRFAAQSATVKWENVISVPKEGDDNVGVVAGFCTITRTMKLRIRAAPAQRTTQCAVDRDTSDPAETGDNRRIVNLWQTTVDKAAPIHLARPHPPAAE